MWAAKWIGKKGVMEYNELDHGQEEMVRQLHAVLTEADVVVGHNIKAFDLKWANTMFIELGLPPATRVRVVDTLQVVRANFKLPSYSLDYLCKRWGLGEKIAHEGIELWLKWELKNSAAKKMMQRYCKHDVSLTQKLYYHVRSYIHNHPNMALFSDMKRPVCPSCGSNKVVKKGKGSTDNLIYQRYKCNDCGNPRIRGKSTTLTKEQRDKLLTHEK
jgi:DNA polymerase III epsilon subunit-like protein